MVMHDANVGFHEPTRSVNHSNYRSVAVSSHMYQVAQAYSQSQDAIVHGTGRKYKFSECSCIGGLMVPVVLMR